MIKVLLATSLIASSFAALSNPLTVEEQRINKAQSAMPNVLNAFTSQVSSFEQQFKELNDFNNLLKRHSKTTKTPIPESSQKLGASLYHKLNFYQSFQSLISKVMSID